MASCSRSPTPTTTSRSRSRTSRGSSPSDPTRCSSLPSPSNSPTRCATPARQDPGVPARPRRRPQDREARQRLRHRDPVRLRAGGEARGRGDGEGTGGKAKIIKLEGTTGSSPAIDRKKGFDTAIKGRADMKVIVSQSADFTRAKGQSVAETLVQSTPMRRPRECGRWPGGMHPTRTRTPSTRR